MTSFVMFQTSERYGDGFVRINQNNESSLRKSEIKCHIMSTPSNLNYEISVKFA